MLHHPCSRGRPILLSLATKVGADVLKTNMLLEEIYIVGCEDLDLL